MVYTVSQINKYIKGILDNDFVLNNIYIEAEISNFKLHSSGHLYFTIKDEQSSMNAIMFRSFAQNLKFMPYNGLTVTVFGYISLYEKTGQYAFYAEVMEPKGIGALYMAYEKLKNRLAKAGLFDEIHKKPIPAFSKTIAVITSPTGAAVRDIIRISQRRNPGIKIVISPTLVQGENAADDIVRAIKEVNEWAGADVIILGRGGGSIEDLWAFNEEKVARAVFESKIPIISAVGHETDFTISDFIADMRASTPSAAAELAVAEIKGMNEKIKMLNNNFNKAFLIKYEAFKNKFKELNSRIAFKRFPQKILENEIYVENIAKKLNFIILHKKDNFKNKFLRASDRLESASPINILKKGYAIVLNDKNKFVKRIEDVEIGDKIKIKLNNGNILAEVKDKE